LAALLFNSSVAVQQNYGSHDAQGTMMTYKRSLLLSAFLTVVLSPLAAKAQVITLSGNDPAQVQLGAGAYNFLRTNPGDPSTGSVFRAQYQFRAQLFYLHPILGVEEANIKTAHNVYGYGGVALDAFLFNRHLVLTPYVAGGGWTGGGVDKSLGGTFEVLVGAQLAYRFSNDVRIGISVDHVSNGGTARQNRGVEDLMAVVSIPLAGFP
jgi:lipid A 3-O-deacylase